MKKALVTLTLIFPLYCGFAQMVVNDPHANAALTKQIAQSIKTVEQTRKTVELLKQTKEMYDDVNSAIKTLQYVTDLSKLTKKIVENSGSSLKEIQSLGVFSNKEMAIISSQFKSYMDRSDTVLKISNDILNGGVFKMKDSERLQLLKDSKGELQETLMDVNLQRSKILDIAEKRWLYENFNID